LVLLGIQNVQVFGDWPLTVGDLIDWCFPFLQNVGLEDVAVRVGVEQFPQKRVEFHEYFVELRVQLGQVGIGAGQQPGVQLAFGVVHVEEVGHIGEGLVSCRNVVVLHRIIIIVILVIGIYSILVLVLVKQIVIGLILVIHWILHLVLVLVLVLIVVVCEKRIVLVLVLHVVVLLLVE